MADACSEIYKEAVFQSGLMEEIVGNVSSKVPDDRCQDRKPNMVGITEYIDCIKSLEPSGTSYDCGNLINKMNFALLDFMRYVSDVPSLCLDCNVVREDAYSVKSEVFRGFSNLSDSYDRVVGYVNEDGVLREKIDISEMDNSSKVFRLACSRMIVSLH